MERHLKLSIVFLLSSFVIIVDNRLSRYLSKGGGRLRVNHHWLSKQMIDGDLLEYKPGGMTGDIQGDGTPPGNIMDNPGIILNLLFQLFIHL